MNYLFCSFFRALFIRIWALYVRLRFAIAIKWILFAAKMDMRRRIRRA